MIFDLLATPRGPRDGDQKNVPLHVPDAVLWIPFTVMEVFFLILR